MLILRNEKSGFALFRNTVDAYKSPSRTGGKAKVKKRALKVNTKLIEEPSSETLEGSAQISFPQRERSIKQQLMRMGLVSEGDAHLVVDGQKRTANSLARTISLRQPRITETRLSCAIEEEQPGRE